MYQFYFCQQLKELRKDNNLTQEELGARVGVSKGTVFRWEQGKDIPSVERVLQISSVFNISPDQLIGASPKNNVDLSSYKINLISMDIEGHVCELLLTQRNKVSFPISIFPENITSMEFNCFVLNNNLDRDYVLQRIDKELPLQGIYFIDAGLLKKFNVVDERYPVIGYYPFELYFFNKGKIKKVFGNPLGYTGIHLVCSIDDSFYSFVIGRLVLEIIRPVNNLYMQDFWRLLEDRYDSVHNTIRFKDYSLNLDSFEDKDLIYLLGNFPVKKVLNPENLNFLVSQLRMFLEYLSER